MESIQYPISFYGDIKHTRRIAIDIGGSLAKLVYLVETDKKLSPSILDPPSPSYHMRFVAFETKYIEMCLNFIQSFYLKQEKPISFDVVYATGGGSIKYRNLIKNKLGIEIQKEDEIDCVIKGSIFLIKYIKNECFEFDKEHFPSFAYQKIQEEPPFPFLLANIGSGVSFIKVNSDDNFERIGGTAIGGGTFWGLGSLLTESTSFEDLINMASDGDSRNVDMLVKDIYGGDYEFMNLPKDLIASFFGKCGRSLNDKNTEKFQYDQKDIAKSLIKLTCYNIGQLAVLYAKLHNLQQIYFGGHFIRNNYLIILTISEAVAFYSNKEISAMFFKHDGFIGALGAFQNGLNREKSIIDEKNIHFEENIATSSYGDYSVSRHGHPLKVLSFDPEYKECRQFPLLKVEGVDKFTRDNVLNIVRNVSQWVPFFVKEFKTHHNINDENFSKKCLNFEKQILKRLECYVSGDPLEISNYLNDIMNIQDQFINEYLVQDPLLNYKHEQNLKALNDLKKYSNTNDHLTIFKYIFAGNLIDFSSQDILKLHPSSLEFTDCLNIIEKKDIKFIGGTFEEWREKFEKGKWKKVLIFVDNSGYDLIIGIFSLVKELILKDIDVVIAANVYPSFNDVVYSELFLIFERLKSIDQIINKHKEKISFVETGFHSPYLNLTSVNQKLYDASLNTDLIIIEGMSRSLIGFIGGKFSCDVMYIGTVSSRYYSERFGMDINDIFIKLDFNNN